MGGKTGTTIALIALGIGAIYLGASGNLASFWTGLRGGYADDSDKEVTQGNTIQNANGDTAPDPNNQASKRPTDRGAGGEAWTNSNSALLQGGEARARSGQYYPGPNGILFVSDGGTY